MIWYDVERLVLIWYDIMWYDAETLACYCMIWVGLVRGDLYGTTWYDGV